MQRSLKLRNNSSEKSLKTPAMSTSRLLLIFLTFLTVSCGKNYDAPPTISTSGYDGAGNRHIPKVGSPSTVSKILSETLTLARVEFTTSPVSFPDGSGYVVGTRDGKIAVFSQEDSLRWIDTLQTESPVLELLVDSSSIISIQTSGHITYLTKDRIHKWVIYDSIPTRCNSIFTGEKLIIATDSSAVIYPIREKNKFIVIPYSLSPRSLAYDKNAKLIYLALTTNSSDGADSILCISEGGKVISRIGFPKMRISSNLSLIGNETKRVAFGYFGDLNPQSSVRRTYVTLYEGIAEGKPKQVAKQEVSYIPMNIASNGQLIVSSGFRERSEELASGIDAFDISTLEKRWQRRFSEPLVAPISISDENIYFTLSFPTTAETPSNGLFYVLTASTGKTDREVAIDGVLSGFAAGMPMPFWEDALMVSDNQKPIIYIIRD
jgi:hypothetical protein